MGLVLSEIFLNKVSVMFLFVQYITDRSKAVLQIWFSVFACFGVGFCTIFTCLDDV